MKAGKKYEIYTTFEKENKFMFVLITCMSVSFLNTSPTLVECTLTREKMDKTAQPILRVT